MVHMSHKCPHTLMMGLVGCAMERKCAFEHYHVTAMNVKRSGAKFQPFINESICLALKDTKYLQD